ncbi:MAG: STAS-like domain-containing protein [Spirochaetaceae bacterium]|nr:STAS-like domain-containing protein [Spirochaetaceae bacterium]
MKESDTVTISVFESTGSSLCVASGDGEKVYRRIARALAEGLPTKLSFRNVNTLTSAFLNAAIGQLYGTFDENQIRALLSVENIEPDDRELLKRVVDTAKLYFRNKEAFEQAFQEIEDDS